METSSGTRLGRLEPSGLGTEFARSQTFWSQVQRISFVAEVAVDLHAVNPQAAKKIMDECDRALNQLFRDFRDDA